MTARRAKTFDAVVVGGGIIGLAVAHAARARGLRVVVLEAGEPARAASRVSAGMLAPTSEAAFGEEEVLRANVASAERWPDWAAALGVPLRLTGSLMVARDRDEAEALEREAGFRVSLGLEVERLLPSAARALEPALAPTVRAALDVPGDLAVDPRAVTDALLASGVEVRAGARVERLEAPGTAVLEGGERVTGERLVLCAGAWSEALAGGLPVRPVKGQILRLRDRSGPGLVERVVRMAGGYLVPRDDGRYVLGATIEEQGWDTTVTAGPVWELLRDAIELVPGLAELELEELSAGLRPGTPDNAPMIGARPDGIVLATGHYRHGVLLAPLTAEWVAAELAGEAPEIPAAFAPGRFVGIIA